MPGLSLKVSKKHPLSTISTMTKGDNRKDEYFVRVKELIKTYKRAFLVNVDNVSSNQMHKVRQSIRSQATVLMGKNTLIRKAVREIIEEVPEAECLLPLLRGNVGIVFLHNDNMKEIRDKIISFKVAAPAKAGVVSNVSVTIPACSTAISPDKTSFFQALGISTKVVKGCIEITSDANVVKVGQVINHSQVELLNMMSIFPFNYGITILSVYENGSVFEPAMLDITDDAIVGMLCSAVRDIAAISMASGVPSVAAVPHLLASAFKDLLSISLASDFMFPAAEKLKEALKNPVVVAAPVAAPAAQKVEAKAAVKEESEEECGFGLFD